MPPSATARPPANPDATPEARELLAFVYDISGRAILSGQHNYPVNCSSYSDEACAIAGPYPAVWGQDFGFSVGDHDDICYRQRTIDEAIRQHAAGSIVTLMWHAVRPTEDEPVTFKESVQGKLTDAEWEELISADSPLNRRWQAQVDVIAGLLAQLQNARVPVLWRPYHEANGDWFWWGYRTGPNGYPALWRMLYERLTHFHGLNNLIWVWNANGIRGNVLPYPALFPGHETVDILATDIYGNDYRQSQHDDLAALAGGKPIAIGECGEMPAPELLESQPLYAWFMCWTGCLTHNNTPEQVRALYGSPRTLNRPARAECARRPS